MKINKILSSNDNKERFAKDNFIRISDVWDAQLLEKLQKVIYHGLHYDYACYLNNQYQVISESELNRLSANDLNNLQASLNSSAANGVGFLYGKHGSNGIKFENNLLNKLFNYLNSKDFLDEIRALTGINEITSASMQVTKYVAGNYLTRHNDVLQTEGRAIAFVFNFTEKWHPDWGGLLQFYSDCGEPLSSYSPKNNALVLFDVNKVHAVTYVTPFALNARYSVTGWFNV